MSELALWAFSTVGLTAILVDGKILNPFREYVRRRSPFGAALLSCYQCSGLYSGIAAAMLVVQGLTIPSALAYGVAGSGLSMIFASLLNLIESVTEAAQQRGAGKDAA